MLAGACEESHWKACGVMV